MQTNEPHDHHHHPECAVPASNITTEGMNFGNRDLATMIGGQAEEVLLANQAMAQ